ncbi:MAG: hypothetical protein HYY16_08450 [Planctomycetes bacterium]|nr:hypothetical protein [Planctomycetota bacterium]
MRLLQDAAAGRLGMEVTRRAWAIPLAFGAAAQAAQVVLAREFLVVFHGNELSIALVFGLWLFWVAVGSACAGRLGPAAALPQIVALPLAILVIRDLRSWFDVPAGHYLPLLGLVIASGAILAVPCLLFGAQFAWALRLVGTPGRTYAAEAGGAALGAATVGLLSPALGSFVLTAMALAPVFAVLLPRKTAIAGLAAIVALAAASSPLDRFGHERYWRHLGPEAHLLETRDSPDGPVAAIERGGEVSIYRSGRLWATLPDRGEAAPIACAILLQHPSPQSVFLAGGSASLLREVLRHGVGSVDVVESHEGLFDLIRRYDPGTIDDARVRPCAGDARRALARADAHDVIIVAAGEPDTAVGNRFYTAEFFAVARGRLTPGGVFAVGPLAAPAGYAADELLARNATIHRTLASVFPQVRVTPGTGAWLLASERPLTLDEAEMVSRTAARGRRDVDIYPLTDRFAVEKANSEFRTGRAYDPLDLSAEAPIATASNVDARPVGHFESLRVWAWQAGDAMGALLAAAAAIPLWVILLGVTLPAAAGRRGIAMFAVGFSGMVVACGALVGFQADVGHLYRVLGFLIGGFMAGTAAGTYVKLSPRWALVAVAASAAGLALSANGVWLAALLVIAGAAVGACYRALAREQDAPRMYALDVAGGCAAAFVAVPLLLPLHGLAALGAVAALPCAVAALRVK